MNRKQARWRRMYPRALPLSLAVSNFYDEATGTVFERGLFLHLLLSHRGRHIVAAASSPRP